MMIQIEDVVVSSDILTEKFYCNLEACGGACCIEGDAGAPVEDEEVAELEKVVPVVWDSLTEAAKETIRRQGVVYRDRDGDLVTSIVGDKDCVFTCRDADGKCYCAIERAYREGRCSFYKPVSCHLYPIRIERYNTYTAVNYHRWDVCKGAVVLGKMKDLTVYQFLKEPLVRKFGTEWYAELEECARLIKENYE